MTQDKHTPGPYIIAPPGGPAGPFWGIVSQLGTVVAMQIFAEADALAIVAGLAHANTPRPKADWSQAPAQAMWWCVDPDGDEAWHELEPKVLGRSWGSAGDCVVSDERIDIPLGIDWRLLKEKRPEAT